MILKVLQNNTLTGEEAAVLIGLTATADDLSLLDALPLYVASSSGYSGTACADASACETACNADGACEGYTVINATTGTYAYGPADANATGTSQRKVVRRKVLTADANLVTIGDGDFRQANLDTSDIQLGSVRITASVLELHAMDGIGVGVCKEHRTRSQENCGTCNDPIKVTKVGCLAGFCDDVNIKKDVHIFLWDGSEGLTGFGCD